MRRRERGQGLVEFALTAVLVIALIFGAIEFDRLMLCYTTVANAARAGSRYASVHGSDNPATVAQIQSVVQNFLAAAPLKVSAATIDVSYSDPASGPPAGCSGQPAPGCYVSVNVSYPYDPLTTYFPLSIRLTSASEGVVTF